MFKKILHKTLTILIGMIKSGIVGVITAAIAGVLIAGIEVIGGAILAITFLLPAMFLYHLGRVLNLKNRTCDIFYFIGFIAVELLFGTCIVLSYKHSTYDDGSRGFSTFFFCIFAFVGIAVYLAELIFRNRAIRKNLEKK
jgi:hypothetical protein